MIDETRVNFDYWRESSGAWRHERIQPVTLSGGREWMDLDIRVLDQDSGLSLWVTFNGNRYDREGILEMLGSLRQIILRMVANGDEKVSRCMDFIV